MSLRKALESISKSAEKQSQPAHDGKCFAHECPCAGVIKDGNIWLCRFHYGLDAIDWPRMTSRLKECLGALIMTKWIRDEAYCHTHEQVMTRIGESRFVKEHPSLIPQENETPGMWANRAEGWISAPIGKNKGDSNAKG